MTDPTYHYPIQPRTDGVPSPPVVAPPEAVGAPAGADGTAGGQGPRQPSGATLIAAERGRHIRVEGWTAEHDREHTDGSLVTAAVIYAKYGNDPRFASVHPMGWPWAPEWWKPTTYVRSLVKAGALIAAEIDRVNGVDPRDDEGLTGPLAEAYSYVDRRWQESRAECNAERGRTAIARAERDAARSRLAEMEIDLAESRSLLTAAEREIDRLRVEAARPRRWRDRVRAAFRFGGA